MALLLMTVCQAHEHKVILVGQHGFYHKKCVGHFSDRACVCAHLQRQQPRSQAIFGNVIHLNLDRPA